MASRKKAPFILSWEMYISMCGTPKRWYKSHRDFSNPEEATDYGCRFAERVTCRNMKVSQYVEGKPDFVSKLNITSAYKA